MYNKICKIHHLSVFYPPCLRILSLIIITIIILLPKNVLRLEEQVNS